MGKKEKKKELLDFGPPSSKQQVLPGKNKVDSDVLESLITACEPGLPSLMELTGLEYSVVCNLMCSKRYEAQWPFFCSKDPNNKKRSLELLGLIPSEIISVVKLKCDL